MAGNSIPERQEGFQKLPLGLAKEGHVGAGFPATENSAKRDDHDVMQGMPPGVSVPGVLQGIHILHQRTQRPQPPHTLSINCSQTPIIHYRNNHPPHPLKCDSPGATLHGGVYSTMGSPTCQGMATMDYVCTDPASGKHLFRCPAKGCELKKKGSKGWKHCDSEVWEDPYENLWVVGVLARASTEWKGQYAKCMTIERLFSSLKRSRGLEPHRIRGLRRARLHVCLSLLIYQATALARIETGGAANLRKMRV